MLWDEEFKPLRDVFDRLPGDRRFALAVAAIDRTLDGFDPPLEGGRPAELLRECLNIARAGVDGGFAGLTLPDGAAEELSMTLSEPMESGVGPLILAVVNFFELPEEGLPAQALYAVFSHCYEAVYEREEAAGNELRTVEDERANPRLTATIAWEKELLAQN
jgi:hypothetical protein